MPIREQCRHPVQQALDTETEPLLHGGEGEVVGERDKIGAGVPRKTAESVGRGLGDRGTWDALGLIRRRRCLLLKYEALYVRAST
jgi:hypothetical protein